MTQKGWNIPTERPERQPEDHPSQKVRSSSRNEPARIRLFDEYTDNAHDSTSWFFPQNKVDTTLDYVPVKKVLETDVPTKTFPVRNFDK